MPQSGAKPLAYMSSLVPASATNTASILFANHSLPFTSELSNSVADCSATKTLKPAANKIAKKAWPAPAIVYSLATLFSINQGPSPQDRTCRVPVINKQRLCITTVCLILKGQAASARWRYILRVFRRGLSVNVNGPTETTAK